MNRIIIYILLGIPYIITAQSKFDAKITTWYKNKQAAVSVSFDDASYTQFSQAYPILKKHKIKATFSLVGEWTHEKPTYSSEPDIFKIKKMGWQEIVALHNEGNEIAVHGMQHRRYKQNLTVETLANQMKEVKDLIENKIKAPVYTMHYPYSFTSDSITKAVKKAGFLFGRTGDMSINSATPKNNYLLISQAILNNETPNISTFKDWLKQAKNKWLILMYHHIFLENSKEMRILNYHKVTNTYSLLPKTFENQIEALYAMDYWIAPIVDVGRYIQERDKTKLSTRKFCKTFKIKTKNNLNKDIYNLPLTIKVRIPWKKIQIQGSIVDGVYQVENGEILIDFIPGATIKIKKK